VPSDLYDDLAMSHHSVHAAVAAPAPDFHNGFAATLDDVVDFYETRFGIGLMAQEKADLIAFLRAL
jgi:cytochrome c peroxidase